MNNEKWITKDYEIPIIFVQLMFNSTGVSDMKNHNVFRLHLW